MCIRNAIASYKTKFLENSRVNVIGIAKLKFLYVLLMQDFFPIIVITLTYFMLKQ